jgi:hypothetical protein
MSYYQTETADPGTVQGSQIHSTQNLGRLGENKDCEYNLLK